MSNVKSYKIRKIEDQDKESIILFLLQNFCKHEPLNEYLNRERGKEIIPDHRSHVTVDVIAEGLSLMAVSQSNEIVGVCLNEICKHNHVHSCHPNATKISKIIDKLEDECAHLMKLENVDDKEMNVNKLSVSPEWGNKGIGLELLKYTRALALEKGFCQIKSVCTSEYSAKAFEKLGFKCIYSIKYADYEDDGKIVFKPNLPHTHIKMMFLKF